MVRLEKAAVDRYGFSTDNEEGIRERQASIKEKCRMKLKKVSPLKELQRLERGGKTVGEYKQTFYKKLNLVFS